MRIDTAMGMQNQQLVEKTPISFIRQWFISTKKYRPIIYTMFLCVVIVILTTKNITKEDTIYLQGDMSRYVMNGVYFHDLVKDFPINNIIDYEIATKKFQLFQKLNKNQQNMFLLGMLNTNV